MKNRVAPKTGDYAGAYRECSFLLGVLMQAEAAGSTNAAAYMAEIRSMVRRKGAPAHRPRQTPDLDYLRLRREGGSITAWLRSRGVTEREKLEAEVPTWRKREQAWRRTIWQLWLAALCPTAEQMRHGHNKAQNLITLARQQGTELELPRDADLVAEIAEHISPEK